VSFDLAAYHGETALGRGKHRRAIVRLDRLVQGLAKAGAVEGGTMHLEPNPGDLPGLETLSVELNSRIATITLNRPQALNAVNTQMTAEWEEFLAWLAGHPDDPRVVIVTGAGRAFCAGDDVKEVGTLSADEARQLSLRQAQHYLAFETMPQPFIAAVNGPALGAGCVCACSCDFRLATHGASFGMPEVRLGWPPGYGVAQLTALVGKARALDLCLTGRTIGAREALDWGLVNELASGYLLLQRARQLAGQLLELPPLALRETKRIVHLDEGNLPKVAHRLDTEAYIRCLQTADAREGIEAFKQKRPARFQGR
jgi:enoyl-CoA hydratase